LPQQRHFTIFSPAFNREQHLYSTGRPSYGTCVVPHLVNSNLVLSLKFSVHPSMCKHRILNGAHGSGYKPTGVEMAMGRSAFGGGGRVRERMCNSMLWLV